MFIAAFNFTFSREFVETTSPAKMCEENRKKIRKQRGQQPHTSTVVWKEASNKKISSPGGLTEFFVILILGEKENDEQPIFCLTLKEKPSTAKFTTHSITFNKQECEWLIANADELSSGQTIRHSTENKGEVYRVLSAVSRKGKGVPTILFKQKKNGKEDQIVFPRGKLESLIRYFSEAVQDFEDYHVTDNDESEHQASDESYTNHKSEKKRRHSSRAD